MVVRRAGQCFQRRPRMSRSFSILANVRTFAVSPDADCASTAGTRMEHTLPPGVQAAGLVLLSRRRLPIECG